MKNSYNIMIVGVGGQGSLLASRLLGNVFMQKGFDVKVSEVHGMSQRGGSVVTYVKAGDQVFSPTIEPGEADAIISFEQLEGARWISYLKKDGTLIVNTQKIDPMPVITGAASYPENLIEKCRSLGANVIDVDALSLAEQAGSAKATNVVLMGVLANHMNMEDEIWQNALTACVPKKFMELNQKAFALGKAAK
ncbi:MAG: indolepyruvate oxidoreductase subunit beta [Clostridiales bacterium]|nr:indolepyruvate oxidoreductase subunit beta [Clostridiales bacterium]